MTRFYDWPTRLEIYLHANADRRFRYGDWDCCLFVADAIEAMTGTDIAADFIGRYRNRAQAFQVASRLGIGQSVQSIAESVAARAGMREVGPLSAGRGDMALIRRPRDFSMGIVALSGREILIAMRTGFAPVPMDRAVRAWKV